MAASCFSLRGWICSEKNGGALNHRQNLTQLKLVDRRRPPIPAHMQINTSASLLLTQIWTTWSFMRVEVLIIYWILFLLRVFFFNHNKRTVSAVGLKTVLGTNMWAGNARRWPCSSMFIHISQHVATVIDVCSSLLLPGGLISVRLPQGNCGYHVVA